MAIRRRTNSKKVTKTVTKRIIITETFSSKKTYTTKRRSS